MANSSEKSIIELLEKPFSTRTFSEKLLILQNGRPCPSLSSLKSVHKDSKREYIPSFKYGTRHIIDSLVSCGYKPFQSLLICGGLSQDPLFVQIQADSVGLPVLRPHEKESVLVGSSILGACASKYFPTIEDAIMNMGGTADAIKPNEKIKEFHDKKYRVFLKMYKDQLEYRSMM